MTDDVMKLIVHPGIGDLSWLISKISTTGQQFDLVIAEDSKTRRSMPLVDMIPCIRSAGYGGMDAYVVLSKCTNCKWTDYIQAHKDGKDLYITANWWVDAGKRLEGFLPDLDTDFHYQIILPEVDVQWAQELVGRTNRAVGIYTSGRAGINVWHTWTDLEWMEFIRHVHGEYPTTTFFLLGARWDMDMRLPMIEALERERIDYVDLIGRTTLQRAVALLKELDYFAGFASGLTILADVVDKPCLMLYPEHLNLLMKSWPDPQHLADGTYQGHVWARPVNVFERIRPHLDRYLGN